MMTANLAYKKFLLKFNKNDTNSNIKISKAEFVVLFNEQKRSWIIDKINSTESSDLQELISELLETDKKLEKVKSLKHKDLFKVPDNLYQSLSSYSIASKGECKNRKLINWKFKIKNLDTLLIDSNNSPSFDYEETLYILSKGNVEIYKSDFNVDKAFLTYYREPSDIDIAGYRKLDGTASTTIDPDFDDRNVEEVINKCVIEATINTENVENFQTNKTRDII